MGVGEGRGVTASSHRMFREGADSEGGTTRLLIASGEVRERGDGVKDEEEEEREGEGPRARNVILGCEDECVWIGDDLAAEEGDVACLMPPLEERDAFDVEVGERGVIEEEEEEAVREEEEKEEEEEGELLPTVGGRGGRGEEYFIEANAR